MHKSFQADSLPMAAPQLKCHFNEYSDGVPIIMQAYKIEIDFHWFVKEFKKKNNGNINYAQNISKTLQILW